MASTMNLMLRAPAKPNVSASSLNTPPETMSLAFMGFLTQKKVALLWHAGPRGKRVSRAGCRKTPKTVLNCHAAIDGECRESG